jgi:hypothetical protein
VRGRRTGSTPGSEIERNRPQLKATQTDGSASSPGTARDPRRASCDLPRGRHAAVSLTSSISPADEMRVRKGAQGRPRRLRALRRPHGLRAPTAVAGRDRRRGGRRARAAALPVHRPPRRQPGLRRRLRRWRPRRGARRRARTTGAGRAARPRALRGLRPALPRLPDPAGDGAVAAALLVVEAARWRMRAGLHDDRWRLVLGRRRGRRLPPATL